MLKIDQLSLWPANIEASWAADVINIMTPLTGITHQIGTVTFPLLTRLTFTWSFDVVLYPLFPSWNCLWVIRIFLISSGVSMISFEIIIWSNVGILCRSRWTLQILELQHTKWGLIFQWDQVHIFLLCALFIKPQIIKMMLEKIEFQCKLTTRDQRKLANKH